jgi:hypothetical protein
MAVVVEQTTSGTLHLQVTGQSGLPLSGVSAVVLNVTVTELMGAGFVSVYGDGTVRSPVTATGPGSDRTYASSSP